MSSLVLVARTEKTGDVPAAGGAAAAKTAPFYYGDTLLYPNVGEPLVRGRDDAVSFYFVVYPAQGRCACTARIALLRNGTPIAETTRDLPTAEVKRYQHVGHLPIGDLPNGTYELRVTIGEGTEQQTRTAFFSIRD